jgi:hypothetical protein
MDHSGDVILKLKHPNDWFAVWRNDPRLLSVTEEINSSSATKKDAEQACSRRRRRTGQEGGENSEARLDDFPRLIAPSHLGLSSIQGGSHKRMKKS